jgi:hypothetical protein
VFTYNINNIVKIRDKQTGDAALWQNF